MKFITLNNTGNKILKAIPTKTIIFNLFQVNENMKDLIIKCPYNGNIVNISASTNNIGTIDTELKVEKINESDFKNKINNWINILNRNIIIRLGQVVDDNLYVINNDFITINKNDYFRINLLGLSDLKNLNLEIEIETN